jgi:hypothetical protein
LANLPAFPLQNAVLLLAIFIGPSSVFPHSSLRSFILFFFTGQPFSSLIPPFVHFSLLLRWPTFFLFNSSASSSSLTEDAMVARPNFRLKLFLTAFSSAAGLDVSD